ncbi:MAG TPA: hypothetical protein VFK79_09930 [Xanthobacteraceae bacterium]|nr:hypothetical protein [Xanthobacteraceae bacterium]
MKATNTALDHEIWLIGGLAGAAGGIAEILWIGFYGALTGTDTTVLAQGVAAVIGAGLPPSFVTDAPVASGLAIHMIIAIALGIALALAWRTLSRRTPNGSVYQVLPAILAIIWVFNFFVLLPILSPHIDGVQQSFTELVPYPVSLVSKLLFGFAAAAVLKRRALVPSRLVEA